MRWLALISSSIVIGAIGCAGTARPEPRTAESIVREQEVPLELVEAATGTEVTLQRLLSLMREKRVVYVGERHDRPHDHGVQYSLLRRLHQEESSLAIGMEMFQVPFQDPLDRWSAGEIDEKVLREATEYDRRWGFDFGMYRPMLEYAQSRGLEVVALNAPREVVFAVAKDGVEALPEEVAATLPELELDDPAHRALFNAEFDPSQHDVGDRVDRYYQAQVVWDETMAERVAETLGRPKGPTKMIVFAGRVHVKRGLGIPERAARRGATPYAVVMPVTQEELKAELELDPTARSADIFWVVPE